MYISYLTRDYVIPKIRERTSKRLHGSCSKARRMFALESIPTTNGLGKSLHQQGLSGCPLFQDQKKVPSVTYDQLRKAMIEVLKD